MQRVSAISAFMGVLLLLHGAADGADPNQTERHRDLRENTTSSAFTPKLRSLDSTQADGLFASHAYSARKPAPNGGQRGKSAGTPTSVILTYAGSTDWTGFVEVEVSGDYAYCVAPYGLMAINVSDPADPVLESATHFEHRRCLGLDVVGNRAYTTNSAGLQIVDISNPAAPLLLGSDSTPGWPFAVAVDGTAAYVADYHAGLSIVDVSEPSSPALISTFNTPGTSLYVATSDTIAWVADYSSVQVVNVTDPTQPQLITSFAPPGHSLGIEIQDTLGYVASSYYGLHIVDISDPTQPMILGNAYSTGEYWRIALNLPYAFVAADYGGLRVIDVSEPASPLHVASLNLQDEIWDVDFADNIIFLAGWNTGLSLVSSSTLPQLTVVGSYGATPGDTRRVTKVGSRLYVACGDGGMRILDCSVPGQLTHLGRFDTPGYGFEAEVSGRYAFIADDATGLQIVDVLDPEHPQAVAGLDSPGRALGVAVSGGYCWIADWTGGARRIDISDPHNPSMVDSFGGELLPVRKLAVRDSMVYVTDGNAKSPAVVLVKWPANGPAEELARVLLPDDPKDLVVHDTLMYVADDNSGIVIVNVADAAQPIVLSVCPATGSALGLSIMGDYLFVASLSAVQVFDVANPLQPSLVSTYATSGNTWHALAEGSRCWVADYWALLELRIALEGMLGDVNCDLCLDLADVAMLGNALDGQVQLTDSCSLIQADVNQDGDITEADYEALFNAISTAGP
jgi:hypothetical protein